MEHQQNISSDLPENAYRELNTGEEYKPVMPANQVFLEVTPWSVFMGLLMAVIFSAAAAYSGLKIGQVFEAAIPISIIAVGASVAARKKNALGQNVIIQSIGASSGVIVAGAIFTIPALYILQVKYPGIEVNFWQIFFSSLLGGILGILFLIPFRKYFVKDMHGKFPFPEATAITEILITGAKGAKQAKILIVSGLIGGLYDFMFSAFRFWDEMFTSRILPFGEAIADKAKIVFKMNISALIFSFGFLVGLRFSLIIVVGSLLSWFVFVPLINEVGNIVLANSGSVNPFAGMSAEAIFKMYVRPIGIGGIAMAGVIGIIRSAGVIGSAFKLAFGGTRSSKHTQEIEVERTQKDIKMPRILLFILLTIIAIFFFLLFGVNITIWQAAIALITLVVVSFLFTTVAANAIAIVGTNPVSGMTLMTLILSSFVLVAAGLSGWQGMVSSLVIGGIVCTALSMAGGFITDLKVGYWLGSSPYKQQSWKFLGTLLSAATVGVVIFILSKSYGFVNTPQTPNPLVAPQANAMAAVIEPLMLPGAKVYWILYLVGAVISLLLFFLNISSLAFALGMFIPLDLNTPLIVGGLLAHWFSKSTKNEKLNTARGQRGTLIASGFIAGAALFGVVGALLLFFDIDLNVHCFQTMNSAGKWEWEVGNIWPQLLAFITFCGLIYYFVWDSFRAKVEE
ncbi:MAG: oligopeptide transporter, OPT family [Bacteroidota bacterium]